ncbi:MAG: hypothetical protein AAGD05_13100, partial [Bacteroidota bacterium]
MMKNVVFTLILTVYLPFLLMAQNLEGEIIYTQKLKMEIELPEDQEYLRAMIPSSRTSQKVLYFTPTTSLYK